MKNWYLKFILAIHITVLSLYTFSASSIATESNLKCDYTEKSTAYLLKTEVKATIAKDTNTSWTDKENSDNLAITTAQSSILPLDLSKQKVPSVCLDQDGSLLSQVNPARQVALVTGTSRGLGKAIAKALRKRGIDVIGTARSVTESEEFKENHNLSKQSNQKLGHFDFFNADLSHLFHPDTQKEFITNVKTCLGNRKLDFIVHNAGVMEPLGKDVMFNSTMLSQIMSSLTTNLFAPIIINNILSIYFNSKIRIVYISSIAGDRFGGGENACYSIGKCGGDRYVVTQQKDMPYNGTILLASIDPGHIETHMHQNVLRVEKEGYHRAGDYRKHGTLTDPEVSADHTTYVLLDTSDEEFISHKHNIYKDPQEKWSPGRKVLDPLASPVIKPTDTLAQLPSNPYFPQSIFSAKGDKNEQRHNI